MNPSLATVQQLATELSPLEQIQLIAYLSERIVPVLRATDSPKASDRASDAWSQIDAFWQSIEQQGKAAPSVTTQLLEDRRRRQTIIEGSEHDHA